jgi:hypothetical protein
MLNLFLLLVCVCCFALALLRYVGARSLCAASCALELEMAFPFLRLRKLEKTHC